MEKLCENLVYTYNTNFLDNEPIELKKAFYNETKRVLKNPECIRGRKVLNTLIENHFEKQKPQPKFIGGPQTLTMHISKIHQKIIYIFGEYHSKDMECDERFKKAKNEEWGSNKMSVEDFFYNLILTTDVFIDFFFEFPAYSKDLNKYTTMQIGGNPELRMQKLLDYFKKCVQYSTRSYEECKLARVHYFDIRREDNKEGSLKNTVLLELFKYKVSFIMKRKRKNEWAQEFRNLLSQNRVFIMIMKGLSEKDNNIFLDFCMTFFIHSNKFIVKELKKVNPDMQDLILNFIRKEFLEKTKQLRKMWQHNIPIIFNYSHKDKAFVLAIKTIVSDKIIVPMSLVADTYALARILKNFDMKDMEKAYTGATDQPSKAHNIIIYTGDLHAQTYRKFLDSINFTQIARSGISSFENITCLNMKTIPQPLFSVWPK
jgi:hypothetical protein